MARLPNKIRRMRKRLSSRSSRRRVQYPNSCAPFAFSAGAILRQMYTQSSVSLSPPSGSGDAKSLYSDEYACVLLTNEARLIRLKRTAQAYPDLAALLGSYEK